MPCTNQVLVVALSSQPWESQSEIRKEWRRVELINVTVLGRTDKGFRDSRSVFHALTETLIYYKEKKMGSGWKWGAGFASLRESVILARPRDHYLSSAFA